MISNHDKDDKEIEAITLIDQAQNLADMGKGVEAINLFEKAAQIFLDLGSYIKLDELFIQIIKTISQFKNTIQAVYRLQSIIHKTEELKLDEISAKLLIQLGSLSFKMKDWESAGEAWQKASEYLINVDPEEYLSLSSYLLIKAGQTFERSKLTKDMGKRLILKGVMKANNFENLYEQEERRALVLIEGKQYEAAAKKFYDIASYFRKSHDNLDELLSEVESKDTILNVKARFIHFIAEYQVFSALCLRASEKSEHDEKIEELGKNSIELFKKSISLLKDYLFPIKYDFDQEILLRICFDTMLLAIMQEMSQPDVRVVAHELLLESIGKNKKLVQKLKKTPYFKITERIEKLGIREALEKLLEVNLGHFEKIKNSLIEYFLST